MIAFASWLLSRGRLGARVTILPLGGAAATSSGSTWRIQLRFSTFLESAPSRPRNLSRWALRLASGGYLIAGLEHFLAEHDS